MPYFTLGYYGHLMTLIELLHLLKRNLGLVIGLPIICAVAMAAVSFFLMSNQYTAKTSMYVLAQSSNSSEANLQSSLSASQMITNDVAALIKSDRVMRDVSNELGLEDLKGFDISVSNETTTRVVTLSVTGKDPSRVADVANAIARDVSDVAQEVMEVESVNVIDSAEVPDKASGPNRAMYTAVALLAGFFIAVAIILVMSMLDTSVRDTAELEELLGVPVIGQFPAVQKGGK